MRNRFGLGRKEVQRECAIAHLPRHVINQTFQERGGMAVPPDYKDWAEVVRRGYSEKQQLPMSRRRETHCAICGNKWPD